MSSEELGVVAPPPPPAPPSQNSLTSQPLLFSDDSSSIPFSRGDERPKTRHLGSTTGFIGGDRFFSSHAPEFRRSLYLTNASDLRDPPPPPSRHWNGSDTHSGDATDGNEEDDDDDDDEDDDDDVDDGVPVGEVAVKDVEASARATSNEIQHQGNYQNAVTIAEADGEVYYSQYLRGTTSGQKDIVESQCGFSGRKEAAFPSESGDSLRSILSDPITGDLMDDAVVLPCGHSFGSGGIQQVIGMKACSTCARPISEDSILPNLSLRTAVQAFRREEELLLHHSSKRRRERFEQDKGSMYGGDCLVDASRGSRGVQFPFAVMDRVIIKGNKRTPPRFVGREAIVTTQCLNGWYVVKTVDNAESVKLQYRSLAKLLTPHSSNSKPPPWHL